MGYQFENLLLILGPIENQKMFQNMLNLFLSWFLITLHQPLAFSFPTRVLTKNIRMHTSEKRRVAQRKYVSLYNALQPRHSRFLNKFWLILDKEYENASMLRMENATSFTMHCATAKTYFTSQGFASLSFSFSTQVLVDY